MAARSRREIAAYAASRTSAWWKRSRSRSRAASSRPRRSSERSGASTGQSESAATASRSNSRPATAARSSVARSATASASSRAASSASIEGGRRSTCRCSPTCATSCSRNSGLPPAVARIARVRAPSAAPRRASRARASSSSRGSSRTVSASAQPGRCSRSSGRASASTRTGARGGRRRRNSTRSRSDGCAQCTSSSTSTSGRSRARSSSAPATARAASPGVTSASIAAELCPERLDDRRPHVALAVRRTPPHERRDVGLEQRRQLGGDPRLPHAGLADDGHDGGLRRARRGDEPIELVDAPDERDGVGARHRQDARVERDDPRRHDAVDPLDRLEPDRRAEERDRRRRGENLAGEGRTRQARREGDRSAVHALHRRDHLAGRERDADAVGGEVERGARGPDDVILAQLRVAEDRGRVQRPRGMPCRRGGNRIVEPARRGHEGLRVVRAVGERCGDDRDGPPPRGRLACRDAAAEGGVLPQDRRLELLELPGRLDPQLVERRACRR